MKKIVAINCSPRVNMNTGTLVREAAKGAEAEGAEVQLFDLYRLDNVHGCMSCFTCKLAPNEGKCIFKDGLAPALEAIRDADGGGGEHEGHDRGRYAAGQGLQPVQLDDV